MSSVEDMTHRQFENHCAQCIADFYIPCGFDSARYPSVEGWSGWKWKPDQILHKDGKIIAVFEFKNTGRVKNGKMSAGTSFRTNILLAFAELSDIWHRQEGVKCFCIYNNWNALETDPFEFSILFEALDGGLFQYVFLDKDMDDAFHLLT